MNRFLFILWVLALPALSQSLPGEAIATNNRGVGLMGRFAYADAEKVFAELVAAYPNQPAFAINLAIATLNRQQEGDETRALDILTKVLAKHPRDARANYCAALLLIYSAREDESLPLLEKALAADQTDPFTHYQIAQIHMNKGQVDQALVHFDRALNLNPYFQSACYGSFRAWQQKRDREKARAMMTRFQRLKNNPRAFTFEFKYSRMGPKASAATLDRPTTAPKPRQGPFFAAPRNPAPIPAPWTARAAGPASISVCDLDGDGDRDFFIPGILQHGDEQRNGVYLRTPEGFTLALDHPLARVTRVNGLLWGDVDNDGTTDAYLLRKGPNQLWQNSEQGWKDITATALVAAGDFDSCGGAFADADHDGDLDLFVINANGPNELLNNDRDGAFRPLAAEYGLAGNGKPSAGLALGDLDGDRDLDLVVLNKQPPHEVYLNDRLWQYQQAPGLDAFRAEPAFACVTADLNGDGELDILTLTTKGLRIWSRNAAGAWAATTQALDRKPGPSSRLGVLDTDGDGHWEAVYSHASGWSAVPVGTHRGGQFHFEQSSAKTAALAPILGDPATGPALLELTDKGQVLIHDPGPGRFPFLALTLSGRLESSGGTRSNASGIGTSVAVRTGSRWTNTQTLPAFSGPAQHLQPLAIGMAENGALDFVSMLWSDGVFQSELDLQTGKLHAITETQRQLASCPVLFAWNGEEFGFVSDVLGVAGIGFNGGRGEYAEPRSNESFPMPAGSLKSKDGFYEIRIGEPMEEVCYLDAARLTAYDLPPGWQMVIDERMHVAGEEPSGKPLFYREERLPVQAFDRDGKTILEALGKNDLKAPEPGPLDHRFLGLLKQDQVVTVQFDKPMAEAEGQPMLVIDGWVEYPYSQTVFAAWQAGRQYRAPTLEARDGDGNWHTVMDPFGYPAGMPRRMAVLLPDLPKGANALRLTTNLQVYWDRLALAYALPCPQASEQTLPPAAALLNPVGFPKRTTNEQMVPDYDYNTVEPFWDTRHMAGSYTAFGPVLPLVAETDNAVAIFGPGEEIQLRFAAPEADPAAGFSRRFVLELNGWCKDMDLYTQTGETVGPLPEQGNSGPQREKLHRKFNTRYRAGL